jgi:Helix-turn-helix domain
MTTRERYHAMTTEELLRMLREAFRLDAKHANRMTDRAKKSWPPMPRPIPPRPPAKAGPAEAAPMMSYAVIFGRHIRYTRLSRGLSVDQFAARIAQLYGRPVSPDRLRQIERGEGDPRLDLIVAIAGAAGQPVWALFDPTGVVEQP